ncbi:MAG TPA: hypothetical protein VF057_05680 [Thermoanaerobaculia bacterium]
MDERQLKTIENVTANFFFWQGLRWVPLGAVLLAWVSLPRDFLPHDLDVAVMAAAMFFAFALSKRIGAYYERTYGRVRGIQNVRRERWKWNFVYPLMIGSLLVDGLLHPPFLVSGPVWAAAILLYWNSTGRGRRHYLVIAAVVAATFFFPSLDFFFGVIGAAYVLGGLLDHFELTRILRPLAEDGDARTV